MLGGDTHQLLPRFFAAASTKGSCAGADLDGHSIDIDIAKKCELLVDPVDDPVAIGMVYRTRSLVHQPLADDMSRVS
ncbi:hypothetical protein RJT34_11445 [Clitoria ternatea]|uniref:Uncharacterized protein n=1 Tax=Clitoria ternatea TaxID=43366 RepID=A0AAN9JK42_CLITE